MYFTIYKMHLKMWIYAIALYICKNVEIYSTKVFGDI